MSLDTEDIIEIDSKLKQIMHLVPDASYQLTSRDDTSSFMQRIEEIETELNDIKQIVKNS